MPEEPGIERATARAEAYRIIADPRFRTSSRNRDFLSYIVDALLEGRADRIKAYFIAVDVFGRPESFDPTLDPIVRIEATRLRGLGAVLPGHRHAPGRPPGPATRQISGVHAGARFLARTAALLRGGAA